jgi:ABC-type uncharacterized transport system substrate-binding protein
MAAKILKGEAMPADFTIERQSASILHINYDAAKEQGVEFPAEIEERAAATFGEQ